MRLLAFAQVIYLVVRVVNVRIGLTNRRNLLEWLDGRAGYDLVIPRKVEAQHIQITGDTGAGKTSLIRKIVREVERTGETAVIVDPKREFVPEFYRPERGDMIWNPQDARCRRWLIENEAFSEAAYTATAVGMFPEKPMEQAWFNEHARAILAYLLARYHPSVEKLAAWLADEKEIDRWLAGSEHAVTLTKNAPPQRAGILGTLNKAGKALRMLPTAAECQQTWSVRDWVNGDRCGWIFLTSTPDTLDALLPLMTLWLDMILLALQHSERHLNQYRVWTILDEVTSLNVLPKLHSGLTQNRAADHPIVLGFQSFAMVRKLYGHDQAEAMLSQAYTNFILRSREPATAEHMSKLIGYRETERVVETMQGKFVGIGNRSWSTQRVIEPVILPSEIQGLPNLQGYVSQGNYVVPIRFKPDPRIDIADGLIERKMPAADVRVMPPTLAEFEAEQRPKFRNQREELAFLESQNLEREDIFAR